MTTFAKMVDLIAPCQKGVAVIQHHSVSPDGAFMASIRRQPTNAGTFCVLRINGGVMMSDTYYEHRTNRVAVQHARGKVLIGGLGIGMLLVPILANPEVTRVTVLELHQDVIDLVLPQLAALEGFEKLEVICCDALTWQPPKGECWDMIYWDIWPSVCTDNLPEITHLKRRFARRLTKGGWQGAWVEGDLRQRRALEKQQSARKGRLFWG